MTLTLPRSVGEVSSSNDATAACNGDVTSDEASIPAGVDAAPAAPKKAGMLAAAKSVLVDRLYRARPRHDSQALAGGVAVGYGGIRLRAGAVP